MNRINEDKNKIASRVNKTIPLDEFLLFMVFSKNINQRIRNEAIKALISNFRQRENLVNEIVRVELMIAQEDIQSYYDFKF